MKIKKLLSIAIIGSLIFAGCSNSSNTSSKKKVGILQFVQHAALDESREGFIEEMKNLGYEEGKNIEYDYQNASGDTSNTGTIAGKFANASKDLVLAIATPSAQAMAQNEKNKPILITAVTDPAQAGLVKSNDDVGGNVTGTSDKSPVDKQLKLLKDIYPNAKRVGVLYSSSEDNSKTIFDEVKKLGEKLDLEVIEATVQNSNDVQAVMESLVGKVDAIYTPTDNVISSSMSTIAGIADKNKIPIIAAEESQVKNGALCTIGINYKELGKQTARMADKILKGEKKPSDMPIEYLEKLDFSINEKTAKNLGLDVEKIRELVKNE